MKCLAVCLAAIVVVLLVACGGGDKHNAISSPSARPATEVTGTATSIAITPGGNDRAAAEALEQEQFADISRGDRGAEWELLHPVDQGLISKDRWIECTSGRDLQLQVKVSDVQMVHATVPALGEVDAWQLKIDITGNIDESVQSVYDVYANGQMRWTLDQGGVDRIKGGQCP